MDDEIVKFVLNRFIERDITCEYYHLNYPKPPIYIGPVKVKTLKERLEEFEMKKATSTQEIKNVKDIIFSIDNYPMETESKLTIVASTDDDIFEFVFEGSDLLQSCKKAGLFTGWEKDQEIREKDKIIDKLKHENDKFKDKLENVEPFRVLEQTIREKSELRNKLNLEKAANEAQHKFFRKYAGKGVEIQFGYPIDTVEEVSYVIVDKEKYESLKNMNDDLEQERAAILEENDKLRYAFDDEVEENKKLRKKCEHLDKALQDSQRKRDKWYNEHVKKQSEQDSHNNPVDNVNHPSHYTGKFECIDVMQDVFGNEATDNFCLCNAFKYIWRARKKNGLEDVKKAVWYLNKYIEEAEKDGEDKVTGTRT